MSRSKLPKGIPEGPAEADPQHPPRPAATGSDLAAALVRFSERLATFGLGEVTDPLLGDLAPKAGEAHNGS